MADLILFVTFSVLPYICLLGIFQTVFQKTPYLPDEEPIAQQVELIIHPAAQNKTLDLDSLNLLFEEMEDMGVQAAFVSCLPGSGCPLVVLEDDSRDVDVSEFSDALNPLSAPVSFILEVNDLEVEHAALRDGMYYGNTVVEIPNEETSILPVHAKVDIDKMVADILADAEEWMEAGSDESTFFESTVWDDNYEFSKTFVN